MTLDRHEVICPWCGQPYIAVAQSNVGRPRRTYVCEADGRVTVWL